MKHPIRFQQPRARSAFALILVVIVLSLVVVMLTFFLSTATRERQSVNLHEASAKNQALADAAVNLVVGAINAATTEGMNAASPESRSWASQPGMIRTFRPDGSLSQVYKLYSWNDLVESDSSYNPLAPGNLPPAGWQNDPAIYTDLNMPNAQGVFPILDPGALASGVEGFSVTSNAVGAGATAIPMPVKWIYILRDGTRTIATGSGNAVSIPGSSTDNPVVGRIAYWTDDETCKVNINTASEGSYWDWPKAATRDEMQFAGNPPVAGEFHRYPGHPASTSLSSVLTNLNPGPRWNGNTVSAAYRTGLQRIMGISPRNVYADASSRGGTFPIERYNYDYAPARSFVPSTAIPTQALEPDADRLYATVSELFFAPGTRTNTAQDGIDPDRLARSGFFLTAASSAPETTLLETPRISLWPVTWPWNSHYFEQRTFATAPSAPSPDATSLGVNPWMTPSERLIAFAASLNTARNSSATEANETRYFFQRQNPDSATHDWSNIRRNRELVSYLQQLTSRNLPGFGGVLQGTHGATNRDFILANTLNHVRSSVNQYTLAKTDGGRETLLYSFTPIALRGRETGGGGTTRVNWRETNAFRAVPLQVTPGGSAIQTAGNYPVLREATILFFATDRVLPERKDAGDPTFIPAVGGEDPYLNPFNWNHLINNGETPSPDYPIGARTTQMQAVLLLNFANDAINNVEAGGSFWLRVSGQSFRVNGNPIGLPASNPMTTQYNMRIVDFMGAPGIRYLFQDRETAKEIRNNSSSWQVWNLVSDAIPMPPAAVEFNLQGTELTIEVVPPRRNINTDSAAAGDAPIATYTLNFGEWDGTYPVPIAPRWVWGAPQQAPVPAHRPNNDVSIAVGSPGKVRDYKATFAPADPNIRPTQWATAEIAPSTNASSVSDPNLDNGGPPNDQRPVRAYYAFQDKGGIRLMTNFRNRLWMSDNRVGGGTPWSGVNPFAEGDTSNANENRLMANTWVDAKTVITPYDVALSLIIRPNSPGQGDPRLGHRFQFTRIDNVLPGAPRQLLNTAQTPSRTAGQQFHMLGGTIGHPWATGYSTMRAAPQILGSTIRGNFIDPFTIVHGNPERLMARYGLGTVGGGAATISKLGEAATNSFGDTTAAQFIGMQAYADVDRHFTGRNVIGDWSSAPANQPDGGILPRLDQDFQSIHLDADTNVATANIPFFLSFGTDEFAALGNFAPNRQIPSPITILGNLPSNANTGWQTLLFSPNPAIGSTHPGLAANTQAPDHLWSDLFWMPVAEPYPISDQFATRGKINLNYQTLPFPYIERKTALHALMKNTPITALHESLGGIYKAHFHVRDAPNSTTRYPINIPETLSRFDSEVFNQGNVFRSASQLSEMWLVPEGSTAGNVQAFWNNKRLTSDTARETPYDHLLSRVTTKSNTYTVHWKVQSLKQTANSARDGVWNESRDRVLSELEGATLIERYLDPNATDIPDYATEPDRIVSEPLTKFYRWRTVTNTLFRR